MRNNIKFSAEGLACYKNLDNVFAKTTGNDELEGKLVIYYLLSAFQMALDIGLEKKHCTRV